MPTGSSAGAMTVRAASVAEGQEGAAAEQAGGGEEEVVVAHEAAQHVRHDQAHEADRARHGHQGADHQRGGEEHLEAQPAEVHAAARRQLLAGEEQVQLPAQREERRRLLPATQGSSQSTSL